MKSSEYAPSLLGDWSFCAICYQFAPKLDRHEVFHNDMGGKLRDKSKKYGLWLSICPACHARIHRHPKANLELKQRAQRIAMAHYGWTLEDWRREFGKSYLE